MKEIGFDELDALDIFYAMADGLAVLYWHTEIDAMVIELVSGSTPAEAQKIRRSIPLEILMASKRRIWGFAKYLYKPFANRHQKHGPFNRLTHLHKHSPTAFSKAVLLIGHTKPSSSFIWILPAPHSPRSRSGDVQTGYACNFGALSEVVG